MLSGNKTGGGTLLAVPGRSDRHNHTLHVFVCMCVCMSACVCVCACVRMRQNINLMVILMVFDESTHAHTNYWSTLFQGKCAHDVIMEGCV